VVVVLMVGASFSNPTHKIRTIRKPSKPESTQTGKRNVVRLGRDRPTLADCCLLLRGFNRHKGLQNLADREIRWMNGDFPDSTASSLSPCPPLLLSSWQ